MPSAFVPGRKQRKYPCPHSSSFGWSAGKGTANKWLTQKLDILKKAIAIASHPPAL